MPSRSLAFLVGLALACLPADVPEFARELPTVKTGGPVFAFNGRDLDGFYTYLRDSQRDDPKRVFTVADGLLRISGEEFGGITTRDVYADYVLIAEWRWGDRTFPPRVDKARDSGILLHGVGDDGAASGNWLESQECQIIEGGTGDFIMVGGARKPRLTCTVVDHDGRLDFDPVRGRPVTRDSGRFNWWGRDPSWTDTLGFRGPRDVERPAGEWNRLMITCDGDTIAVVLNGVLVNRATGSSHTRGKIQFQSEGAEIHFREISVRHILRGD